MKVWIEQVGKKTYGFWTDLSGKLHGKYKDYKSAWNAKEKYLEELFKVKKSV